MPDYGMICNDRVSSSVKKVDVIGMSFLKIQNEDRNITNKPSVAVPDIYDPKSGQNPVKLVNFEDTNKEFGGPADVIVDRIPQQKTGVPSNLTDNVEQMQNAGNC